MKHKQFFFVVVITMILIGIALAMIVPPLIRFFEGLGY